MDWKNVVLFGQSRLFLKAENFDNCLSGTFKYELTIILGYELLISIKKFNSWENQKLKKTTRIKYYQKREKHFSG
jgi:hypothetical protein